MSNNFEAHYKPIKGEMEMLKTRKARHAKKLLSFSGSLLAAMFIKRIVTSHLILLLFLCISFFTLAPSQAHAGTCEQWVAKIVSAEGTVEARRAGETQWQQVRLDETFCAGDMIRVQDESRADLAFANQPLLRLDQNSAITLGGIEEKESTLAGLFKGAAKIDLLKGAAHFFSRLPRNLEVHTAFVNAGG